MQVWVGLVALPFSVGSVEVEASAASNVYSTNGLAPREGRKHGSLEALVWGDDILDACPFTCPSTCCT